MEDVVGRSCRLLHPVRDHDGKTRFEENPVVKCRIQNLDRVMYLVEFSDGATTFMFPEEIEIV